MVIRQGDVLWVDFGEPTGSGPGYRRPAVVVQSDLFNRSRINTAVVCQLTTNLRRARCPGNVLLEKGEAGLTRPSVVNVTQITTIDRAEFLGKIGSLSRQRMEQILDGIHLLLCPIE